MRTTRIAHAMALCAALLLVGAGCGGKGRGAAEPDEGPGQDAVADVLRTVEQWRQTYESLDREALGKLYDHGDDVTRIHQGKRARSWIEVDNQLRGIFKDTKEIHIRLDEVQVARVAPGVSVVTASIARDTSDGVTTVTENGAVSLVLRIADAGWLIVSEHYSFGRTP